MSYSSQDGTAVQPFGGYRVDYDPDFVIHLFNEILLHEFFSMPPELHPPIYFEHLTNGLKAVNQSWEVFVFTP